MCTVGKLVCKLCTILKLCSSINPLIVWPFIKSLLKWSGLHPLLTGVSECLEWLCHPSIEQAALENSRRLHTLQIVFEKKSKVVPLYCTSHGQFSHNDCKQLVIHLLCKGKFDYKGNDEIANSSF